MLNLRFSRGVAGLWRPAEWYTFVDTLRRWRWKHMFLRRNGEIPSNWKSSYTVCSSCHNVVLILGITVAARSKAWTVFARSNAGIVGSNTAQGMDVCVRLFCVCVVLCVGSGLKSGWSLVKGVLPTVYRIKILKNWPRSNKQLEIDR
jgi:hypothetical protein